MNPLKLAATSFISLALATVFCLAISPLTTAQTEQPAQPSGDQADDSQAEEGKKAQSLDDLLGLEEAPEEDRGATEDAAARDADEELQRRLNEAEIADSFAQAVEKMSLSADLLDTQFDPGLGTQRIQEDIIAKLSQLIDQAKKAQCNSSSSSSSSSAQRQNTPKRNPGQKDSQSNNANQQQRNNQPDSAQEGDPPPPQQADVNSMLEETAQEWGNLPQRVRDALNQGRRDKKSALYRRLTDEYYKRLAEEGAP